MRNLFLISILALFVFLQINGEKVPVNEGAIGDGVFYREVAQNFLSDIENASYNLVQLTRILPFALLNLSFSAFHLTKDNQGLLNGMIIWQVIYLALAVYWYFRICKKLRLKISQVTIGFILLFFNYTLLKSVWYHPFTPDLLAFAFGMGQMNYFLRYEKYKLGMISILGIFVSPLVVISGLVMLFLPGDKLPIFEGERSKSAFPVVLSFLTVLILALAGWLIWSWSTDPVLDQIMHGTAILFVPVLIIYVAIKNTLDWDQAVIQLKKKVKVDRLSKGMMGMMAILLILVMLSGNNSGLGVFSFLRDTASGAFRFPADFIISSTLQWGIAFLFTLIYMSRFLQEMGKLGWAACLIIMLGMVLLPFIKPAALAPWIPIWIVILIKAVKRYRWENKDLIIDGALACFTSLAWLGINSDSLLTYLGDGDSELLSSFAVQKWAIHQPEVISFAMLLASALILALLGAYFYFRRKRYQRIMG